MQLTACCRKPCSGEGTRQGTHRSASACSASRRSARARPSASCASASRRSSASTSAWLCARALHRAGAILARSLVGSGLGLGHGPATNTGARGSHRWVNTKVIASWVMRGMVAPSRLCSWGMYAGTQRRIVVAARAIGSTRPGSGVRTCGGRSAPPPASPPASRAPRRPAWPAPPPRRASSPSPGPTPCPARLDGAAKVVARPASIRVLAPAPRHGRQVTRRLCQQNLEPQIFATGLTVRS